MTELYIGLMSGTSLDGIDGVLTDLQGGHNRVLASASTPMPPALRATLLALNQPGPNELHTSALAANALSLAYAEVVHALLAQGAAQGLRAQDIRALGAHGQTVRHQPHPSDPAHGYTLQLINGALLAERTGIDTIVDFRSRDVAAGGQGAPLVPAFHRAVFGQRGVDVAVLNIGGMANLTVLPAEPGEPVRGMDCGPGNVLLDAWCQRHLGQAYDRNGEWAAQGQVLPDLLADWLSDPYFSAPPPKSTGRERFNLGWVDATLSRYPGLATQDVQATLTALTARSCADCVKSQGSANGRLLVCGGGAYNTALLEALRRHLPESEVAPTDVSGLPAKWVEACAFAWLAQQYVHRQSANVTAVTGAPGPRVLGCCYPAGGA
ncbi:MAG: anhydro-N-acetylmuramic acid kinase [Rhodoferax sp.]